MKHLASLLCLITVSLSPILCAMETGDTSAQIVYIDKHHQPTQMLSEPQSSDETINTIDEILHEKYGNTSMFFDFFSTLFLSQKLALEIIQTAQKRAPFSIHQLYEKNIFYKKAIDHFIQLATDNINTVTPNTLKAVENPLLTQRTEGLNLLPETVKTIVMQWAYYNIDYCYTITLTENNDSISSYDICPAGDLAATLTTRYMVVSGQKKDFFKKPGLNFL